MKLLLTHPDPEHMANARQYLLRHGIAVSVSERAGQLELWLLRDSDEDTALNLLRDFDALPVDHQTAQKSPQQSIFGPTLRTLSQQAGLFTFSVFLITMAVAVAQFLFSPQAVMGSLMITPLHSMELTLTEPWRLVTPAFIHLSATHLVFNLFWWWYLGGRIELRLGARHLLLIFLITAISSNLLQWYTSGPLFGGMSGVVYGLLGFCTLYSWQRQTSLSLPPALIVFMVAWLLLGYTDLLWVNVANEAHLMGLISGALLGAVYRLRQL